MRNSFISVKYSHRVEYLLNVKIKYDIITNEANAEEVVCNATEISRIEGEF